MADLMLYGNEFNIKWTWMGKGFRKWTEDLSGGSELESA